MIPLLIDFDGVIKIGNEPAPHAKEFLQFISDKKFPAYIISNSTLKTGEDVKSFLDQNSLPSEVNCMTTVDATIKYIRKRNLKISVYCSESIKKEFKDFIDDENPDAIVIGDLGEEWNYSIMNEIFRKVFAGADIIAMQKNKFWMPDGKTLTLDAGAFIASIEYASGKEAKLIGKPSPIYFQTVIEAMGFPKENEFIMIGDDIDSDIDAAQKTGGRGILVYTGKTKYPLPPNSVTVPDFEAKDLLEAANILSSF